MLTLKTLSLISSMITLKTGKLNMVHIVSLLQTGNLNTS